MWITLQPDQIYSRLTAPEVVALTTAAVEENQTPQGIIAGAIKSVTNEVCGYVSANASNRLGPDGTIPDELESAALALLRRHLYTRLPGMADLFDELRQTEVTSAEVRLRDTARGLFAIRPPEEPAVVQATTVLPSIKARPKKFGGNPGV